MNIIYMYDKNFTKIKNYILFIIYIRKLYEGGKKFSIGDIKLWDVSNIADVDVRYTMPLYMYIYLFFFNISIKIHCVYEF